MKREQVTTLLERYRQNKRVYDTDKIVFTGVNETVYNISRAFDWNGKTYILGRVEPLESELSKVAFFQKVTDKEYKFVEGAVLEDLQDPCVTTYNGELVVGGTHIDVEDGKIVNWNTTFYKGTDIFNLQRFADAPKKMKDARLTAYKDKILVCTRPQGGVAGCGKIGVITVDSLADITPATLEKAVLFEDLFDEKEWGGANELFVLKNGWIGVLGHIAKMSEGYVRHYYAMTFAFKPETMERTAVKIIAERADFKAGESKRSDLVDVLFSGGIVRGEDGKATLYTGTSDAEGQYIVIDDPFKEYESL
ncbi:MAG: DUF1861 family protein [Clostridia bacterium]|nr:DUF1861 family protein [Clostridia bacterium]